MTCACGHPRVDHRDTVMSVPLVAQTPLYPLPTGVLNNGIHRVHPTATYDQQQCWCGCTLFEAL